MAEDELRSRWNQLIRAALVAESCTWPPLPVSIDERFDIIRQLGHGATANVYLVNDRTDGKTYALKEIKSNAVDEFPHVLETEINLLEQSTSGRDCHPSVVCYYAHFCALQSPTAHTPNNYILMQYIEGKDLWDTIIENRIHEVAPSSADAINLALSLAKGLQHLHSRGIAHRDIKPENIIVNRANKSAVLVDLGLGCNDDSTCSGRVVGTPAYFSPEYARGPTDRTLAEMKQNDIYALGITLLEYLRGAAYKGSAFWLKQRNAALEGYETPENEEIFETRKYSPRLLALLRAMVRSNPVLRPNSKQLVAALNSMKE